MERERKNTNIEHFHQLLHFKTNGAVNLAKTLIQVKAFVSI